VFATYTIQLLKGASTIINITGQSMIQCNVLSEQCNKCIVHPYTTAHEVITHEAKLTTLLLYNHQLKHITIQY